MASRFCLFDFETASSCELKKAGAWVYGADPTTEVLCLGYTLNGAPPVVVTPEQLHAHEPQELWDAVADPDCMFIAHNVAFEKSIWRQVVMPVMSWPDIPDERYHDIMAACAMKGLPLALDRAVMALRLPAQKDREGSKITKAMSKPNKKTGMLDRSPAILQRVRTYCGDDIHAELGLHRVVKGLGAEERRVWLLDQEINQRGVRLDMDFVIAGQRIVDDATGPLLREFHTLTGDLSPASPKFLQWLHQQGCPIPNLQKETVAKYLGEDPDEADDTLSDTDEDYLPLEDQGRLPLVCDRALQIRQSLGSASIKKLASMRACVGQDGRARGLLQYHGAGPGRWAGRLLQPQNFPRPSSRVGDNLANAGEMIDAIFTRDHEYVAALFGDPIKAVASSLRGSIIASDDNLLTVGDFSKIECVIVLAMAGAADTAADVLSKGSAVYTDIAAKVFGRPVKKTDLFEYTVGKAAVLGCGFQMGWNKFRTRYWPQGSVGEAKEVIRIYRQDFAPEVPKMWYGLEKAATRCVWTGQPQEAYGIVYRLEDGWLTARLPSGRRLWYRDPQKDRKAMPWSTEEDPDIRDCFTYRAWKAGQWKTISAYGGLLTENVVQATARDLMVNAMFGCVENNLPLVLTVHDEAVIDAPGDNAKLLEQIMCDQPAWVRELRIPVGAECWSEARYRK